MDWWYRGWLIGLTVFIGLVLLLTVVLFRVSQRQIDKMQTEAQQRPDQDSDVEGS